MKYTTQLMNKAILVAAGVGVIAGCGRTARVDNWPANQRIEVVSEKLAAVEYDSGGNVLTVELDDGTKAVHHGVPDTVYDRLMTSSAKGGFYDTNIKNVYRQVPAIKWQGVEMIPVESVVFDAVYYDEFNKVLSLMREGGSVEQYVDVPKKIYEGYMDAAIKGSYFAGYIKDYYKKPESVMIPLPPAEQPEPVAEPAPVVVKKPASKPKKADKPAVVEKPKPADAKAPMPVKKPEVANEPMREADRPAGMADRKKEVAPVKELKPSKTDDLDALLTEFDGADDKKQPAKKDVVKPEEKKPKAPSKPAPDVVKEAAKPAPKKPEVAKQPEVKKPAEPKKEVAEPKKEMAEPKKELANPKPPADADLDALLGSLEPPKQEAPKKPAPAKETPKKEVAKPAPAPASAEDDLDALLGSLEESSKKADAAVKDAAKDVKQEVKPEPAVPAVADDDLDALLGSLEESSKKADAKVKDVAEDVKEAKPEMKQPAPAPAPAPTTSDDDLDALLGSLEESSKKAGEKTEAAADKVKAGDTSAPAAGASGEDDLESLLNSIDDSAAKAGDVVKDKANDVADEPAPSADDDLDDLLKALEEGN